MQAIISFCIWLVRHKFPFIVTVFCPVILATALAWADGVENLTIATFCALIAVLLCCGYYMTHFYYYYRDKYIDPNNSTVSLILLKSVQNKHMIYWPVLFFIIAIFLSIPLILRSGWMTVLALALIIGFTIMGSFGKHRRHLHKFLDVLCLFGIGPLTICSIYYVQSYEMNLAIALAGLGYGFLCSCLFVILNLRNYEQDQLHHRHTLVVRFGKNFGRMQFMFFIGIASALPIIIYAMIQDHEYILFCSLIHLAAIPTIKNILTAESQQAYNAPLFSMGLLILIYTALFSLGWIL